MPDFFSSASSRMVIAGTKKRKTRGTSSKTTRIEATFIRKRLLVKNQPMMARKTTMTT